MPLIDPSYFEIQKNGLSSFQNFACYLGGSAIQTVGDNPVTAYRQLVQQYAKSATGEINSPAVASQEAKAVFRSAPVSASLSGLWPRLIGVLFKRVPKFGILLGYTAITGDSGEPGFAAATAASILSAPFINPVRMIEKQQRAFLKQSGGKQKPIMEIIVEAKEKNFKPLFRGTVPLMGHSLASAILGLVGQPKLQKWVHQQVSGTVGGGSVANLIASAIVSPVYVVVTNPLSRLEVIMQTNSIAGKRIGITEACKEMAKDMKQFGLSGVFRGQGIGIAKAIVSLSLFHEGRMFLARQTKEYNKKNGYVYKQK